MNIFEVFFLSVALAMDAFAVSMCKGLVMKKINVKNMFIIAGYFGFFQGIMPILGYYLGINFQNKIQSVDHWLAFILLAIIGLNMIKEALSKNEDDEASDKVDFKTMIVLAIATSIDALAIGITMAFLNVNVFSSALIIGIVTFAMSIIGVKLGNIFGSKYEKKAQFAGGFILVVLGIKILIEHLLF